MSTVFLYILGIIAVLIGVAVSIALHELGHLVPAKLFGLRVGQYMIGFGPTLFSRKRGETEYGIKAIPLGGYISMAGMYPPARKGGKPRASGTDAFPLEGEYEASGRTASTGFFQTMMQDARSASEETIPEGAENRVFYKLAVWKRIIIMLGGPVMNLIIAVVLIAIVISGFGIPEATPTVGSVSACALPATSARQTCQSTDPAAPAAAAGLKPGDRVLSIDGTAITSWTQETSVIQKLADKTVPIEVLRGGKHLTLTVTPIRSQRYVSDAQGAVALGANGKKLTRDVGFVGIAPASGIVQQPLTAVLPTVGRNIGQDFMIIGSLPQRLVQVAQAAFGTQARDPNGPVGLIGVGRLAGDVAAADIPFSERIATLLTIVASLNVALFAFNMIPLLPLDGGHIAGALWEAIRRFFAKLFKRRDPGPVDIAKLVPITFAVVIVFGAMTLLLAYADIVKPITLQ